MPKPWELDWSARSPTLDAMPLPIIPLFGRQRPPMLDDGSGGAPAAADHMVNADASAMLPAGMSPMGVGEPPVPSSVDRFAISAGAPSMSNSESASPPPVGRVAPTPDSSGAGVTDPFGQPPPWVPAVASARAPFFGSPGLGAPQPLQWAIDAYSSEPGVPPGTSSAANPTGPGSPALRLAAQDTLQTNGFPGGPQPWERRGGAQPPSRSATASPAPSPAQAGQAAADLNRFSPANLSLGANAQHQNDITAAAQHYALTPQSLAATFGGEAAPSRNGAWDPNSANRQSSGRGIGQFLRGTWIGEAQRQGSYLNSVARNAGWLDRNGRVARAHLRELLDLRNDPHHAIWATADYARYNLDWLEARRLIRDHTPEALAEYQYIAHHEGVGNAAHFLRGTLRATDRIWNQNLSSLATQRRWLAANGNDRDRAYRAWFADYVNRHTDVRRYMTDSRDVSAPHAEALYLPPLQEQQSPVAAPLPAAPARRR